MTQSLFLDTGAESTKVASMMQLADDKIYGFKVIK